MRIVTIMLAQIEAAKRETSVSRFVGEMLREQMRSEDVYEAARRQFFAVAPRPLRKTDSRPPSREEIHDRAASFGPASEAGEY